MVAAGLLVVACGDDPSESIATVQPVTSDGEPDCGGHEPWVAEPDIDFDAPGSPWPEAALPPFLEQWQKLFGGDVVMVGEDSAALTLRAVRSSWRTRPARGLADTRCGDQPAVTALNRTSFPGHRPDRPSRQRRRRHPDDQRDGLSPPHRVGDCVRFAGRGLRLARPLRGVRISPG